MLKNLKRSLETVFGDLIAVMESKGTLALRIGANEMVINAEGRLIDASGGRPAGLEVHVDDLSTAVPAAGASVASGV